MRIIRWRTTRLTACVMAGACFAHCAPEAERAAAERPVQEPELLGPDVVSRADRHETFPTLDPVNGDLWFSAYRDDFDQQIIYVASREGDDWTEPTVAPFSGRWGDRAPRFTATGSTLYFSSNRPRPGDTEAGDMNIWGVDRTETGWTEPRLMEAPLNSRARDMHVAVSDSAFWFASRRNGASSTGLYRLAFDADDVVAVGSPLDGGAHQSDLWIAPDESWMILVITDHPSGHGGDDLYFSRRGPRGWSDPVNLGGAINTEEYEYGPTVSPDGRFLLFNSRRDDDADLYRIRLEAVPVLAREVLSSEGVWSEDESGTRGPRWESLALATPARHVERRHDRGRRPPPRRTWRQVPDRWAHRRGQAGHPPHMYGKPSAGRR